MNTLEAIYSRRSIRSFEGDINAEELETVLKAADAAPVGLALYEGVHLTVIKDTALMAEIEEASRELFKKPDSRPLYGAKTFVLVSARLRDPQDNIGYSNCAGIVENMALAAVELGLGACHIWGAVRALNQKPELVKKLELPEGFVPCCGIILGKTSESYQPREIPVGRIHRNYLP